MAGIFVKSDIREVTIAIEKACSQDVYLALGRAGFIHLFHVGEVAAGVGNNERFRNDETGSREILADIETVLRNLDAESGEGGAFRRIGDMEEDRAIVSKAKGTVERVLRIRARIREKLDRTSRRAACHDAVRRMGVDPRVFAAARLVTVVFGTVDDGDWVPPADERFLVVKEGSYVCGTALAAGLPAMRQFLENHGFADLSAELDGDSLEHLVHRRKILQRRLLKMDGCVAALKSETVPALVVLRGAYRGHEEVLKALRLSGFSSRALFISGWMDLADRDRLTALLRKMCGDRFIAVVSEQRNPDAPVRLRNLAFFRPFELLVKTIGMPANTEIDPTPLTALTFVLMFGLMFGDLGQGLVLALGGLLIRWSARKKGTLQEPFGQAGGILIACGLSAALFGLLYGSLFSNEHIIPALWFHPMEHIMSLFGATILIGVFIIMAGLGANIVNNFMSSRYTRALFEEKGLTMLLLYAAIIFFAVRYVRTGEGPVSWEAGLFIAVPLLLFCLRGLLGHLLFREPKPHGVVEYVIDTLMEIMETGISMLANTVSFIRVGAFALAHAGLSIVTYTLAGIADPAMKSAGALIIIITGNIFIIGLEGLVCGIQSMRLEYYEFYSKFFRGDGIAFTPFAFKAKTSEV